MSRAIFAPSSRVTPDREVGRGGATAVALLESAVTAVEAGHDLPPPLAAWGFGIEQGLHLIAPLLTFVGPADRTQIVKRSHDLAEPLQIVVKRARASRLPRVCRQAR